VSMDESYRNFLRADGSIAVCLKKAMYGLKEASKEWHDHLTKILVLEGFTQSKLDAALFIKKRSDGSNLYILVHVDDMLCIGSQTGLNELESALKQRLNQITSSDENDEIIQYLGYVFTRNREEESISVSQPGFIKDLLDSLELGEGDIEETPCDKNLFDTENQGELLEHPNIFRSLIMRVMYVSKTRPDIRLAVVYLSTKMLAPREGDMEKLMRILKYLNGTKTLGLRFSPSSLQLHCSIDASHTVHSDMKGHTGAILWLGNEQNGPIEVISKKQSIVSASSTEAELIALCQGGESVMWTRGLLEELGYVQTTTSIEQDNNLQ